jgi:Beta-lactamase enzyme family
VPVPRGTARFTIIGLGLIVAAGALVIVVERTGSGPSAGAVAAHTSAQPSSTAEPAASSQPAASPSHTGAAPLRHGDPLGSAAASYVAVRAGAVLAAVYDLGTRQTWTIGSVRQVQAEASVVKLDILEALFARRRGGLSATEQVLAQQMIEDSGNDAATTLWDTVGGASGIRAFNTAIGLTSTEPSGCVQCPGFPWPGWGLSTTTPADQITLLRELVEPGPLITSSERDTALRLMENVTPSQRWGVSSGVPAQATVALKNGWLPLNLASTDWQINSVGWISGLGRNYLIAVLSTGNPTEAYGIDTIDGLSAIVWNRMG